MRAYAAFLKKEWMECNRTYKLLILGILSVLFGMTNPVFAKITPDLLASVMPEGMLIDIPEPSAIDAWVQFYKNMTSLQMIVFFILFGGIMSNEFSKGTFIHVLTKSMPRRTALFAKLTLLLGVWTLSYALCYGITYGYTAFLFESGTLPAVVVSAVYLWVYGLLIGAALLLFGVLCKNAFGALLLTGGFAVVTMLCGFVPVVRDYTPYRLASENTALLGGTVAPGDLCGALIVTLVLTIALAIGSLVAFDKKQL